jgi:hypothetical protein
VKPIARGVEAACEFWRYEVDRLEVIKIIGRELRERGLPGRGRVFSFHHTDVLWLIDLEQIPRTDRVGVAVGACPNVLMADGRPTRANNCPIVFYPETGGEPFGLDRWRTWQALDVASDIGDDERSEALAEIVDAIVDVASNAVTLHDLREMASEGKIRHFIRKDARALLM